MKLQYLCAEREIKSMQRPGTEAIRPKGILQLKLLKGEKSSDKPHGQQLRNL